MWRPRVVRFPLLDGSAVEADVAAKRRPDTHDGTGERRLARSAGSDEAKALAGTELESRGLHDRLLAAGSAHVDVFEHDALLRSRKRHTLLLGGDNAEDVLKAVISLARGREALPVADRDLDGRKGARHHDGGRDHGAARNLALDHQIGRKAEDAGLQNHAEHLGEGRDAGGRFARHERRIHVLGVNLGVANAEEVRHAEGPHRFGVAPAGLGHDLALGAALGRVRTSGFLLFMPR